MQGLKDRQRKALQDRALAGIFEKARQGLRLSPGKVSREYLSAREVLESGREGEIDFEASDLMALSKSAGSEEKLHALQFEVRGETWPKVLVLLDFSFSMKGEKIATLCLIAAMLSLAIPPGSLSILGFDSRIHEIKKWDEGLTPEQIVERVLYFPGGGFTNGGPGVDRFGTAGSPYSSPADRRWEIYRGCGSDAACARAPPTVRFQGGKRYRWA
jgi:hypothetical protein